MADNKRKVQTIKKKPLIKKKNANGYVKSAPIALGTILTDNYKKTWKIGASIGSGGFGDIYSACPGDSKQKSIDGYEYVVKIEPHENGPLFVEMHFYMRNAKLEDIQAFMKSKNLTSLGMPHYVASGSVELNGAKHRFVVMPRYGKDIWNIFLSNNRRFPVYTVLRLAIQMLEVLEYIHHCTYVHGDIKGANILLGFGKCEQQAYLVDFGLASHYTTKDFKPDPKKMHNGTIEYTSRDAHNGVPTMRGDLEILGYNLLHWLGGNLPWENYLDKPIKVQESKEIFFKNVESSVKTCLLQGLPSSVVQYFKIVSNLKYNDTPDYKKTKKYFEVELQALGFANRGNLVFKNIETKSPKIAIKTSTKTELKTTSKPQISKRTKRAANSQIDSHSDESASDENEVIRKKAKSDKKSKIPKTNDDKKQSTSNMTNKNQNVEITVNNNIKNSLKSNKTYEFNFDLDVSMDANVIVNINRKPKKNTVKNSPVPDQSDSDDVIPASPDTPVRKIGPQVTVRTKTQIGSRKSPRGK